MTRKQVDFLLYYIALPCVLGALTGKIIVFVLEGL